jgi:hypothetical protein
MAFCESIQWQVRKEMSLILAAYGKEAKQNQELESA